MARDGAEWNLWSNDETLGDAETKKRDPGLCSHALSHRLCSGPVKTTIRRPKQGVCGVTQTFACLMRWCVLPFHYPGLHTPSRKRFD